MLLSTKLFFCSASLSVRLAWAASDFPSAVNSVITPINNCDTGTAVDPLQAIDGLAASACNQAQRTYAGLGSTNAAAHAARCHCVKAYYEHAKTLADVDLWTTCVGPPNTLIVATGKAMVEWLDAHAQDAFAPCNAVTSGQWPPVDKTLGQVQTVLKFVLDWKGKLLNSEIDMLKQGVQAVIVSALLGDSLPNGDLSPSENAVVSTIINNQGLLRSRPEVTSNASSQAISDTFGVQVNLLTVPVNATATVLQDQLEAIFANTTLTTSLSQWNAKLTSIRNAVVQGYQSANDTAGFSASTPAASATASASSVSTGSAPSCTPATMILYLTLTVFGLSISAAMLS